MLFGKKMALTMGVLLFAGALAGCSGNKGDKESETKSTLKVMHYDERSFYQQYGMLFSAVHPEVEIEVVSTSSVIYEEGKDMEKAMKDFIAEQKPDVLMIGEQEYESMAGEGKLYNLDSFIKKDNFDLEGIAPGIIDYIKQRSGGNLFGLVPSFYSQAIYYNKDMFNKYGIDLPEDRMTWEKLLQLAARFPTDGTGADRVYGLKAGYQTNLYYLGMAIGSSQGLSYINPTSMQMMINSDSWKSVYEMADKAIKSGSLYSEDPNASMTSSSSYEDYLLRDPFIGGKVAMTMEGNYLMEQIKEAKTRLKDKGIQNWDVVTVPVNPQNPEESTGMSIGQIFAIDANTANADAAWKFLSYINGDEFARVTSKLQNGGFSTRTKYIDNSFGIHMEAFYSLKPMENSQYKGFDKIPQQFYMKFDPLTQEEFQKVSDGKLGVAEALDNLQAKGQKLLTEEAEAEKKKKAADGTPAVEQAPQASGAAAE